MVQPYPTAHDLSWPRHPVKTNKYNSAKNYDSELKPVEFYQILYLIKQKRPTLP